MLPIHIQPWEADHLVLMLPPRHMFPHRVRSEEAKVTLLEPSRTLRSHSCRPGSVRRVQVGASWDEEAMQRILQAMFRICLRQVSPASLRLRLQAAQTQRVDLARRALVGR